MPATSFFDFSIGKTAAVLLAIAVLAAFDISRRVRQKPTHFLFAAILGTVLSIVIVGVSRSLFAGASGSGQAYSAALGLIVVVIGWKTLFGPWEVETKATILGVFLFWIGLYLCGSDPPMQRTVRIIAALIALVPAVCWCMLFLNYHRERIAFVVLMFFSGMLATAPILFYDTLVRRGAELNFFLFQVKPESFNRSSDLFVSGGLLGVTGIRMTVLSAFLSFLLVGLIEEVSKFWVLRHSAERHSTSIDDVLQSAVIIGVGFAFAENILNSNYFMAFVQEFLMGGGRPDILGFFSNVVGRSILTTMVHIVATGVVGYFLGLAIFASSYMEQEKRSGRSSGVIQQLAKILRMSEIQIFRVGSIVCGLLAAIILHGAFNFLVTLPDLLPGNPRTVGDLLGAPQGSPLHMIAILLFPSLFYVCGGFWLLTGLFLQEENVEVRGHPIQTEVLVREGE